MTLYNRFLVISVTVILIFTAISNDNWEINIGLPVSPETLMHIFLLFVIFLIFLSSNRSTNIKMPYLNSITLVSFILLLFLIFFDIVILRNLNAFYEINFLILLTFIPICLYAVDVSPIYFLRLVYLLLFILFIQSFFFSNEFDYEFGDKAFFGGETISRLGILGYVSNTLGIILSFFLIYFFYKIISYFKYIDLAIFIVLFVLQILTFSRTGLISALVGFSLILLIKRKFKTFLFLSLIFFIASFQLQNFGIYGIDVFINRFYSADLLNNPRLNFWSDAISQLTSVFDYVFGKNFFTMATDNTFVGIFAGRGLIGVLIYLSLFAILFSLRPKDEKSNVLFIALLVSFILSSLTIDYFGQRKIIYFFSLLLACSKYADLQIKEKLAS